MSTTPSEPEAETAPAAPEKEEVPKKRQHWQGNPLTKKIPAYAILLAVIGGLIIGFGTARGANNSPPSSDAAVAEVPDFLGSPVEKGEVTAIESLGLVVSWNDPFYLGTGELATREDWVEVVIRALGETENIRAWYLCADELEAEADTIQGEVLAILDYPQNRPYGWQSSMPKAMYISLQARLEQALRTAANTVRPLYFPCSQGYRESKTHQLQFDITDRKGVPRQLVISDYDVIQNAHPIEYHWLLHACTSTLENELHALERRPVDTAVNSQDPDATVSEVGKRTNIARLSAQAKMLRQTNALTCK